jgi:hypothetical protein
VAAAVPLPECDQCGSAVRFDVQQQPFVNSQGVMTIDQCLKTTADVHQIDWLSAKAARVDNTCVCHVSHLM